MQHNTQQRIGWLVSLLLMALVGCGGGGNNALLNGTTTTGRSALNVYVTDAFSDTYSQVLVTLYKIELTTDGTHFTTVYEDTSGQTIDLVSLSSVAELLATVTVPTGSYTQARVTFGDHFTLITKSGTSSSVAVDSSVGTVTNGQVAITVSTPARVLAGQTNTVVVDFKLAEFKLVGSTVKPQIGCDNGSTLGTKSRSVHLRGTVANLNAGVSFDLQSVNGRTTTIALSSTTTVVSGQTGSAITLANGQSVLMDGTYDSATGTITATAITLNDFTSFDYEITKGTVASLDTSASRFTLTVQRAYGIQPTGGSVTVETNSSTQFVKSRLQQGSFSDVTAGGSVTVIGSFDSPTQTVTAKYIGIGVH